MHDLAARLAARYVALAGATRPPLPDGSVYLLSPKLHVRTRELPGGLSGCLIRDEPHGSVIWLSSTDGVPRRRFTLFHEIGHYLLHGGPALCLTGLGKLAREREADRFAAHVLMPEEWLRRDIANGAQDVGVLARQYQVSRDAMRRRLAELGMLANMRQKGGRSWAEQS